MSKPDQSPKLHPAALSADRLLAGCDVQRTRRGGPGGQHRNKTETAIVITHRETGVSGQASERRSQLDNRAMALARLRLNLAIAVRVERETEDESVIPGEVWRRRASGGKIEVSVNHSDFPILVAESLDWIDAFQFELSTAAAWLQLSTSQLVKFLKLCPDAWQLVQRKRHELGKPRLK